MTPQELRQRTREFARRVVRFSGPLLYRVETRDIAAQLRRAAGAVSGNYRSAGRARSHKEFTARIGVVLEEADESLHWLEFLGDCGFVEGDEHRALTAEAAELTAIFAGSYKTAKAKDDANEAKRKKCPRSPDRRPPNNL